MPRNSTTDNSPARKALPCCTPQALTDTSQRDDICPCEGSRFHGGLDSMVEESHRIPDSDVNLTHSPVNTFEKFVYDRLRLSRDTSFSSFGILRQASSSIFPDCENSLDLQGGPSNSLHLTTPIEENSCDNAIPQKNVKRCYECNKKHGLLGFTCKCGYVYCDQHRHGSTHRCQYSFREETVAKMAAIHVRVSPQKLERF